MKKKYIKYFAIYLLISIFAISGCARQAPDEPEFELPSIIPEIVLGDDAPDDDGENSVYIINDVRKEQTKLEGRYVSPYHPEYYFEIIEDELELCAAMGKYSEVGVDFFEGLTWICFKNSLEVGSGSQYLYSADLETFYREAQYTGLADGKASYETQTFKKVHEAAIQTEEASEGEAALLYFNPDTFYLGIAFSELEANYPDLEYSGVMAGGSYYYSPQAGASFIFDVGLVNQLDSPNNKDAETIAFSVPAKQLFPYMGIRILKSEIEKITGEELYIGRYGGGNPEVSFQYQGYGFSYNNRETYDILPDTMIVITAGQ